MVKRGVEISNTLPDIAFKHIKPTDHVHQVLREIKEKGHENLIISNTESEVLAKFLDSVKISNLINHVIGTDSHRRDKSGNNTKTPLLMEFLKTKKYDILPK